MIDWLAEFTGLPNSVIIGLLVLSVVQLLLQIVAFVDLARRNRVAHLPKWVWVLVILLVNNGIGAIVYLAVGRNPASLEFDSDDSPADDQAINRARKAVDLLYATAEPLDSAIPAIEMSGLTKRFGNNAALDAIDLVVPQGSVFGFLGPNGAGKSTALNILAGISQPSAGSASILGQRVASSGAGDVRMLTGYLPDVPGFYGWMTGEEFLRFSGRLFGIDDDVLDARVAALLDLAGLGDVTTRVGGYSRGMRQRLGIAQALINAPRLLLLDEPTSALDPVGRKAVLDMIAALSRQTTVFFSTHILVDVERVCDTVAILDKGRLLVQSPIGELKASGGSHALVVELASPREAELLESALASHSWVGGCVRDADTLHITVSNLNEAQRALPVVVAEHGLALQRLESGEASLEEVFVELVGGARS